jgi:glycosyltransferase involved in cell wall biosynthesis
MPPRPRFSIVTAVYNAEPYLADFIRSIEEQPVPPASVEVIAVDDGSTDGSLAALEAWRARSSLRITVLHQDNAGQAAARNAGLAIATGAWVTFTDPDDKLGPGFLAEAQAFAHAHPEVDVMAGNVVLLEETRGVIRNNHPRRAQFAKGTRVANLDREPNTFTGSSTVSLFRLDRLREWGIEFDPLLRPTFEDGHFACRFLLAMDTPLVGILSRARYIYRKREAADSTLARSFADPGRYTTVFERGLLDVARRARETKGTVPPWLQQVLVYELSWYLSESDAISSRFAVPAELEDRFEWLFAETARAIDPAVLRQHRIRKLKPAWIDFLTHVSADGAWSNDVVTRTAVDDAMRLQRLTYRYAGPAPAETFLLDGSPVGPAFAKRMATSYFGRDRMTERIAWLPLAGTTAVRLDGTEVAVEEDLASRGMAHREKAARRPRTRMARMKARMAIRARMGGVRSWLTVAGWRLAARVAAIRYRDAWVLQDRLHDADDNAERLFEHLVRERPDINAWFTIEAGTADWDRMRAAGTRRVVPYGGRRWRLLMLNARWLLSSHADTPVVRPRKVLDIMPEPRWKVGFLQHGVIKDDLSPWLNDRELDLFVVSTEAELESIVGDGTRYTFTRKETRLTGLPRFDRLLAKAIEHPAAEADLVLVAPTWRSWLTVPVLKGSQRHDLHVAFWESDYIRSWKALLGAPEVAAAVRAKRLRLGFMPHPNLQQALDELELPPYVERLAFEGTDVQALYAQTALLVTDYSSVAFNLAYIDRPVVYYQFDRDRALAGEHVGRLGYFDYERDGYGPVIVDPVAAVAAMVGAIEAAPRVAPEYAARTARAFPVRDGRSCERVVAAIEDLGRPWVPPVR